MTSGSAIKAALSFQLAVMAALIFVALLFPAAFTAWLSRPELYLHAKFIHVLSVTLFFANAVIGTIWEARSLVCGTPEIIRYTYRTVAWLDAVFTAPLILIAVCSGIMLGTILGGVGSIGWVSTTLFLFGVSGTVWVLLDIPMQYRVNRLFETVEPQCPQLPQPLRRLLWRRMGINFLGMLPLLVGFYLMVHKPAIPTVASWFHSLKITKNR